MQPLVAARTAVKRPLIGVTGPDTLIPTAWWFIRWSIWRNGGRALRLTPQRGHCKQALDGVVISGGDDIDPQLYMPDAPDTAPMDAARDAFEIDMIKRSLERGTPLLGICRGAQLLNVVLGGTLHADLRRIRQKTSNRRTLIARKTLFLDTSSRLHDIMGCKETRINSLHHQAIAELGEGLTVVGQDLDGITQAVENPQHDFLFGVQWHPEYLPLRPVQQTLFRALCEASAKA